MNINQTAIDTKGGKITDDTLFTTNLDGSVDYIDQNLLLIIYKNNSLVDVSFHDSIESLSVKVIFNSNWEVPVYKKTIALKDNIRLLSLIKEAIDIAAKG